LSSIVDKARVAATNEVKKVGILIFLGVELLFFGIIFGVPITLDTNVGRVFAVLGFVLTLIGAVGGIITYYEVYNDYLTANIPELQATRVITAVKTPLPKVHMLEEIKPRTVQAADLWVEAPLPVAKPKTRRQKAAASATTAAP
jgi:hypothetical protein